MRKSHGRERPMCILEPDDDSSEASSCTIPIASLWALAFQNNRDAFTKLYLHYRAPIGRYVMPMVRNQQTVEDIYQETFCRVWKDISKRRMLPSFQAPIEKFESWLFRIARNLAIDHIRGIRNHKEIPFFGGEAYHPKTEGLAKYLGIAGHEEQVCN